MRLPCEGCGAVRAVAHHDDYVRPLDVRWLCPRCHRRHHAMHGEAPGAAPARHVPAVPRLSPELYEQLRALAEKHERSVNWTIGRLLRKAVAERPEWHDEAMK